MVKGKIGIYDLGLLAYQDAWKFQQELHAKRLKNEIDDALILLEHPHTITLGKSGHVRHLLIDNEQLKEKNIDYIEVDRGGDITYHGPGQLVVYPILNLNNYYKDVHRYLRELEEVVISLCSEMGFNGERQLGQTGVWVAGLKLCAIGVKVSRWITMHGIALNVNTNLDFFNTIVPCGITDKGVTSLELLSKKKQDLDLIKKLYVEHFLKTFNVETSNKIMSINDINL
jgi:lipoyl(octanoyl) transferase